MEMTDVKERPNITIHELSGKNLDTLSCINDSLQKLGEEKLIISLNKKGEKNTLKAYKEKSGDEAILLYKFPALVEESGENLSETEERFMVKLRSYHCQCHNKMTQD